MVVLFLTFSLSATLSFAQSDKTGQRRVSDTYVITNATIIPEPGKILSGQHLLFTDGVIESIGRNITIPANAQEIKGDSLFLYPGFIDMGNKTGVSSPEIPEKPSDFDPSNPLPEIAGIHPYFSAVDHYYAKNNLDPDWRKLGFTMAQKLPMGNGMLPGITAVVLYGHENRNNLVNGKQALYAKFGTVGGVYPNTKLGVMAKWRDIFQNTQLYSTHKDQYAASRVNIRGEHNKVFEAMVPVLENHMPVLFEVSDELDMRRVMKLRNENHFRLTLIGIHEGEQLIPLLKQEKIDAVLTLNLPKDNYSSEKVKSPDEQGDDYESRLERSREAYKTALSLAGKYEESGIPFSFSTKHLVRNNFFDNLRLMIENGLSKEAALAALTINPAKMLGLENVAGTLEKGKMANLIALTDTLFKKEAEIPFVIVDGYLFEYETKKGENGKTNGSQYWNYTAETDAGTSQGLWMLKKTGDTYEGTVTYDDPDGGGKKSVPLQNIKVDAANMSFEFQVDAGGNKLFIKIEGEISGENFSGKLNIIDFGSFPVKATKTEKPD